MKSLLALSLSLAALAPIAAADDLEGFAKTYADAQKQAQASGKPMYLHFTTTWCGWCRKIEKDCYAADDGKKALADFSPASLDCTVEQGKQPVGEVKFNLDMMKKYGGGGFPFLVILTPDGDLLRSWAGYKPLGNFLKELQEARGDYTKYKEFVAYAAKADKSSYEYNARAMDVYSKMMNWDAAVASAKTVRKLDPKNDKGDAALASFVLWKAAVASKNADDVQAALNDVVATDAGNKKGYFEQALWETSAQNYAAGKLDQCLAVLTKMAESVKDLKNPQQVYRGIAVANFRLGKLDEAAAALEKGIAIDPASPAVKQMTDLLQVIKRQKEKATSTAPTPVKTVQ